MWTRRKALQALLVLPAVGLAACSGNKAQKLPKGAKVVALGDSLTFGFGASKGQSYPDVLRQKTDWQIENMGVNGDTTQNVLDRLDLALAHKPRLTLLGVGGNDVLRRVPAEQSKNNLNAIVQRLLAAKSEVVLIAQPYFSLGALLGRAQDNPIYKEVAKAQNAPLFADAWSKILSDPDLKSDQIHANDAGYRQFAEELYRFLQKQGYA